MNCIIFVKNIVGRQFVFKGGKYLNNIENKPEQRCSDLLADGDLAGNRTRDCAVRGRRLNRLTTRPFIFFRVFSVERFSSLSKTAYILYHISFK